jgi:hypothetical protein
MAFEFLFAPSENTKSSQLMQGDILRRTDSLKEALKKTHKYYAESEDYGHFMVLTQSCDLVKRGKQKPKARYITLAAVRPFRIIVDRLIKKHQIPDIAFPVPICDKKYGTSTRQLLERYIHNTELGYFFIRKDSHPNITEDLCAFLSLSVAIRATHYDACIESKIAQLSDVFQAKVGWLTGNIYSRIGTPDIVEYEADPDRYKAEFLDEIIFENTVWLSTDQIRSLKNEIKQRKASPNSDTTEISREAAHRILQSIPDQIELIASRATEQLKQNKLLSADSVEKAKNVLKNDRVINRILSSLTD